MANSRLQKLGEYLRPHWQAASLGISCLLVVNLIAAYIPRLIGHSVDRLQTALQFQQIVGDVVIIFILASIMWVIRMSSRLLIFGVGRKVEFDLKQRLFEHLLTLEPGYFAGNKIGDLINRATSDVDNIRRLVGFAVLSLANTFFAYSITLPLMLAINVRLTLFSIAVYPFMLVLVRLFSDKLRGEQQEVQEQLSSMSDLIQEDMSGISLIKIYAQEENEKRAFAESNQKFLKANLELAKTRNVLFPMLGGLASVSLLILLATGAGAISSGELSVGNFVSLLLYIELLVFPTALLGFTITVYQRGEVSIDRVESILTVQPKIKNPAHTQPLQQPLHGKITAVNLNYTYPGTPTPALKGINFTINPGETVAIVGPIGSGKSTLANAIPRLLDIAEHQLFLDHQDITQVDLRELRKAIAYVPQDSFLFSTSIRNNIAYGEPMKEYAEIELAAKQAQIHPEILNFPQQYETLVGERGITLSGGQRQRTALARALLMDAPILILDDALSSVDNQTASDILQNLATGVHKKTVVFISHQMSAASMANRIFVMDRGEIVQTGTHEELVQQKGLYQSLWNQQKLKALLN